jgi:hypothetical protein
LARINWRGSIGADQLARINWRGSTDAAIGDQRNRLLPVAGPLTAPHCSGTYIQADGSFAVAHAEFPQRLTSYGVKKGCSMDILVLFMLLTWLGCTIIMTIHAAHTSESADNLG